MANFKLISFLIKINLADHFKGNIFYQYYSIIHNINESNNKVTCRGMWFVSVTSKVKTYLAYVICWLYFFFIVNVFQKLSISKTQTNEQFPVISSVVVNSAIQNYRCPICASNVCRLYR